VHIAFAALFFFAILTLWVPAFWPVSVFETGVFALAAVAVLRARRNPPRLSIPLAALSFAVLWGVFQLLSGRTVYAFDTRTATVRWTTFLATFFVGLSLFRSSPVRHWFRSAMLWFAFLVSVLGTLQILTSEGRVFWLFRVERAANAMGPIIYHNHYAAFIEVALPIALYRAMRRQRGSVLYSVMAAAMYASVIVSASRGGSILVTAEVIAVPLALWVQGRAGRAAVGWAFLRIAAVLAIFTLVVGPETLLTRFRSLDPSADARLPLAATSLHMTAAHPWTGTGLGTWPTAYPGYATFDAGLFANQAHSDWLEWAVEGGLPLAAAMAALFAWSLRPAFRSVWGLGVVAVFLHATVDFPFNRPALGSWPIVILAMLAAHASSPGPAADSGSGALHPVVRGR
jgi:O-antigen ligase